MKLDVNKNTKRNIAVGFFSKIILMILPFVTRTIIHSVLGADYLGLGSLFSSIMQVLSLADLGLSSAVVYHMYRPIAENDQDQINALLGFYRRAYRVIGLAMLGFGAVMMFFLPYLVKGSYPAGINIYGLFAIYVVNSAVSFFLFGYKQSLLAAYQREDIKAIVNLMVQLSLQICQIVLLLTTHDYYLFVLCMPVFTVIGNLWIGYITKKIFPKAKADKMPDHATRHRIKQLMFGTFIQKACGVTRNSLDSICVSMFLGLVLTGIYNNYYVVFNGVLAFLGIISTSLSGGIGHHVAVKSAAENFEELKKLDFLFMTLSGICTVCLLCLYQPFMKLWMGEDMLLPMGAVVLLCLYFYALCIGNMKYLYNTANGLWWELRWRAILETVANVALNIILGKYWGVNGIIAATLISLFLFNFCWGSTILFKAYFQMENLWTYFGYHLRYFAVTAIICAATWFITNALIVVDDALLALVVKGALTPVIAAAMYGLVYCRTDIFKQSLRLIKIRN